MRSAAPSALVSSTLALSLALWLGGLVTLVILVSSLFSLERSVFVVAAPRLFHVFERYQIGLAILTTLSISLWQAVRPARLKIVSMVLIAVADVLSALQILWITPTINASRGVDAAKFDRFHHLATQNYSTITLLILAAGLLFLITLRREARQFVANDTAPAAAAA